MKRLKLQKRQVSPALINQDMSSWLYNCFWLQFARRLNDSHSFRIICYKNLACYVIKDASAVVERCGKTADQGSFSLIDIFNFRYKRYLNRP